MHQAGVGLVLDAGGGALHDHRVAEAGGGLHGLGGGPARWSRPARGCRRRRTAACPRIHPERRGPRLSAASMSARPGADVRVRSPATAVIISSSDPCLLLDRYGAAFLARLRALVRARLHVDVHARFRQTLLDGHHYLISEFVGFPHRHRVVDGQMEIDEAVRTRPCASAGGGSCGPAASSRGRTRGSTRRRTREGSHRAGRGRLPWSGPRPP